MKNIEQTLSLRVSGHLLVGVIKIYNKKVVLFLSEAEEIMDRLKEGFKLEPTSILQSLNSKFFNLSQKRQLSSISLPTYDFIPLTQTIVREQLEVPRNIAAPEEITMDEMELNNTQSQVTQQNSQRNLEFGIQDRFLEDIDEAIAQQQLGLVREPMEVMEDQNTANPQNQHQQVEQNEQKEKIKKELIQDLWNQDVDHNLKSEQNYFADQEDLDLLRRNKQQLGQEEAIINQQEADQGIESCQFQQNKIPLGKESRQEEPVKSKQKDKRKVGFQFRKINNRNSQNNTINDYEKQVSNNIVKGTIFYSPFTEEEGTDVLAQQTLILAPELEEFYQNGNKLKNYKQMLNIEEVKSQLQEGTQEQSQKKNDNSIQDQVYLEEDQIVQPSPLNSQLNQENTVMQDKEVLQFQDNINQIKGETEALQNQQVNQVEEQKEQNADKIDIIQKNEEIPIQISNLYKQEQNNTVKEEQLQEKREDIQASNQFTKENAIQHQNNTNESQPFDVEDTQQADIQNIQGIQQVEEEIELDIEFSQGPISLDKPNQ